MKSLSPFLSLDARLARALTLLVPACIGAGLVGAAARPADDIFALLQFAGLCGALLLFLEARAQLAHAPDRHLDEYERKLRDNALRTSHQITVAALFAAFAYSLMAPPFDLWLPKIEEASQMLFACAAMSMALPGMVLAWDDTFNPGG